MEEEEEEKISAMEEQKRKKERGERKKNCSHELNAARKKYHSRQQPYYPSNGGRTDPRTGGGRRKTGGRKAGQRGKRNLTDQDIDHSAPFGSKSRDRSPDSGKISRRDSCLFEETHFSRGGRLLSARGLLRLIRPKKSPLPMKRKGGLDSAGWTDWQTISREDDGAREGHDEAVKRFVYHTPGIFASVNVLSVRVCGTTLTPPLPPFSAARVSKQ